MTAAPSHLVAVPDGGDETRHRIATSIVALLSIRDMPQSRLAAEVGMDPSMISKSITLRADGTYARRLQLDEAGRIADVFGVSFSTLLVGGDELRRRAWAGIATGPELGPDSGPGLGSSVTDRLADVIAIGARQVQPPQGLATAA